MEGVVLALDAGVLDHVASVCLKARHRAPDMLVNLDDLLHRGRFKKGGCDPFLNTQDYTFRCCYLDEVRL